MVVEERTVRAGYKMTELGEIPIEWEIVTLGTLTYPITKGTSPSTYKFGFVDNGINFFKVESLTASNKIKTSNIAKVSEECHQKLKRSQIQDRDILISIAGSLGRLCIVENIHVPANTNQALAIIRLIEKKMVYFMYYALQSQHIERKISDISTTGAQPNLSLKQVSDLPILLPSIYEQLKIAEILSTVDEQIENTEKLIEKTRELKKGLMQQLLTRGIGHTEFKMTELGEIPVGWEVRRLRDVLTVGYGKNQKNVEVVRSKIPILGTGGIIGWAKQALFDRPSVLIGRKGTIDKPRYMETPFWTIDTLFYTDINQMQSFPKFIFYLFQTIDWYKFNEATGVPSLSASNISNIKFLYPPLKEQEKIAEIISSADEQIESYEHEKEKYTELKKGLMQQLLTGKIRVTV